MPTVNDLMGVGVPAAQAARLGNTAQTLTPAGTTQGAATTILLGYHITLFTSVTGATGLIFATNSGIGTPNYVYCATATTVTGVVYCQSGGTMNGATNGGFSVAAGKMAVLIQTSQNNWAGVTA